MGLFRVVLLEDCCLDEERLKKGLMAKNASSRQERFLDYDRLAICSIASLGTLDVRKLPEIECMLAPGNMKNHVFFNVLGS